MFYSDNNRNNYSKSLIANLKWFVRRTLIPQPVDQKIIRFLSQAPTDDSISLNLGCGIWTPYDRLINRSSKKIINIDATILGKLAHPLSGRVMLINDLKLQDLIKTESISRNFVSILFPLSNWIIQ